MTDKLLRQAPNFAVQALAAEKAAQEMLAKAIAEGYVYAAPGLYEKRDAEGALMATLEF